MGDIPTIVIDQVNITYVLYFLIAALSIMGTLIKIFGKTPEKKEESKTNELPGNTVFCKGHKENMDRIEKSVATNYEKQEKLKDIVSDLEKDVGIIKNQNENMTKNMDEMKRENKDLVMKLDDLLKKLMDWMND